MLGARGAVVFGADHGDVLRHDPGEDVGEARAPFVVVAARGVAAGDVVGGSEGASGLVRAALAGDLVAGEAFGLQAELLDDAGGVADQPFVVDHVVLRGAVGDGADREGPAGRFAEDAVAEVGAGGDDAVRGEKAGFIVAGPDHVLAQKPAVGEFGEGRERAVDGAAVAVVDARGHAHRMSGA